MPDAKIVMGQETEYGFPAEDNAVYDLMDDGDKWLGMPYIDSMLANGGRFYIDCEHPEYATPECENPWDLVRCARAGDRLVTKWAKLYRSMAVTGVPDDIMIPSLSNVSYTNFTDNSIKRALYRHDSGDVPKLGDRLVFMNRYGSHESYSMDNCDRMDGLFSHMATRLILCGAGGVGPHGCFTLSPRAACIYMDQYRYRMGRRRAINPLIRHSLREKGPGRLHVTLGDSLCSDRSLFLKFASTALLVLIADNNEKTFPSLRNPAESMWRVIHDPGLKAKLQLMGRGHATALEIQEKLVEFAGKFLRRWYMPAWAPGAWAIWRDHVALLAGGHSAAANSLDWCIKHALYSGLKGKLLADVLMVDARFGRMAQNGLFVGMDRSGALDCSVSGCADVKGVMSRPPKGTRAEARGAAIRTNYKDQDHAEADWDVIHDYFDENYVFYNKDPRKAVSHYQP